MILTQSHTLPTRAATATIVNHVMIMIHDGEVDASSVIALPASFLLPSFYLLVKFIRALCPYKQADDAS